VQLVPLDLVGYERGHHVVDVRRAGDVDRERVAAVEAPDAAARRGVDGLPGVDRLAERGGELLGELSEYHALDLGHAVRQAVDRVDESARIRMGVGRAGVEHRAGREVGGHERAQLHVARAAQDGTIRPNVQLDGILLSLERPHRLVGVRPAVQWHLQTLVFALGGPLLFPLSRS